MSENEGFFIRAYEEGDEHEINRMFNEVFHQSRDLDAWRWEFRDNPYGRHFISVGIASDGTYASHFSGYPALFYCAEGDDGRPHEVLTLQCADKMTRKQFRSSGLMGRTHQHFSRRVAGDRVKFSYAFAAADSLRLGTKIGYADIGPVHFRRLQVPDFRYRPADALKGAFFGVSIHEVTSIDEEWSAFFDGSAPGYDCLIKKDETYFRWRYLLRPNRRYLILASRQRGRLTGWSVFFRDGERIVWGDAMFKKGDRLSAVKVLDHLLRHAYSSGAKQIEGWFPSMPDWWNAILDRIGFVIEPEPNGLHLVAPTWNDKNSVETILKRFYYTIGDSDLF